MPKKAANTKRIVNRRAAFDYIIGDTLVVGMVLTGAETKSLRLGHGQLQGAYVTIKDGELWLINATIHGNNGVPIEETDQTKTRKLLAKRNEISRLLSAKQQGNTIIPLEILTGGRHIKLKIALAKGKRQYDKRQTIKKREENRQIDRLIKE